MSRLNYAIVMDSGSAFVSARTAQLLVYSNYSGNTYGRIYLQGSTPPAFTPLTDSGFNVVAGWATKGFSLDMGLLPVGLYIFEFKDDTGAKSIGKLPYVNNGLNIPCYGSHANDLLNMSLSCDDNSVTFQHYISFYNATSPIARKISIDGGATYKQAIISGFNTATQSWTNAEIAALGITSQMASIVMKRDSNNCTTTIAQNVNIFNPISIGFTKTDATKYGGANGTINITVSGGSGNYSYVWSDGPNTQNRTLLTAGSYTVTATDNVNGMVAVKTIVISQPPQLVASYLKSDVTVYNGSDGSITVTVSGGSGNYTYTWSDGPVTKNRSGLSAATYSLVLLDTGTNEVINFQVTINQPPAPSQLQLSYLKSDVTVFGGLDGSIDLTVSGGTAPYSYIWNDGLISQDRSGLKSGVYTVTVTDSTAGTHYTKTLDIVINQPVPPPPPADDLSNFLDVPLLNSITFIVLQAIDNINTFANHRNTLFADQVFPGFSKSCYFQKICRGEQPTVQFNSNFANHSITLRNLLDDSYVKSINFSLKEKNIGLKEDYSISIRNHVGNPGKSRIYFNTSTEIPIPVSVDDVIEVLNNVDGFNGNYAVVDIDHDDTLGQQYLVINRNYDILANSSNALGRFDVTLEQYNVFESEAISFADVADGKYYIELVATGDDGASKTALSEPIHLKAEHPGTNVIDYKNIDNAYDITWTTGYTGRIRVESVLFKRLPGGERTLSRNSDFSLVKVSARKQRIFLFETYMLPPWLHEKLSVIFDTDYWKVNGVQYQSSDSYGDPEYIYKFALANSSIKIEQVGWFGKYNSDDLGSVNDGGFILANGGYIKR